MAARRFMAVSLVASVMICCSVSWLMVVLLGVVARERLLRGVRFGGWEVGWGNRCRVAGFVLDIQPYAAGGGVGSRETGR
ncbi:hypothetical protein GCM10008960_07900 [Deinococcus sedimenti]|uniref:Secreted protein n=1 Tax=Deinococcus sedimenti TaxID=1867090 RepID=A0ABQ2S2U7_9DEIO|nr:hypothetical protein GCM10008960_07900 [Deinococcus sedimenti]